MSGWLLQQGVHMESDTSDGEQGFKRPKSSPRRTGAFFSMADFEQRIAADPDVLGMMYVGSQGRGDGDRYSDLDVSLWVKEEVLDRREIQRQYLSWLGELHFMWV